MKKRNTIVPPTLLHTQNGCLQFSVHKISAAIIPEIAPSLPQVSSADVKRVFVVPTFQKCGCAVIDFTPEAAVEKDRLLETFVQFASGVQRYVQAQDEAYWCDYVDPCTGYVSVRGASPYCETSAMESFLPYCREHVGTSAGGCSMISHPQWGLSCYPATLFALCPVEVLMEGIKHAETEQLDSEGSSEETK